MDAVEIIVLIGAVALVAFTVIFNIIRKKKGKSSCGGCACSGCSKKDRCGKN